MNLNNLSYTNMEQKHLELQMVPFFKYGIVKTE